MKKIYDIGLIPKLTELAERFMFPFPKLSRVTNGGLFDRVTMVASLTNHGKTTLVSQIVEHCIEQGYKCCCFFGEDTAHESQDRIFKQSMRNEEKPFRYVHYKDTNCGELVLSDEAFEKAKSKFVGKLFLYNTNASAKVDDILAGFEEARINHGCRIFVLDNVDQFEFASENENKALKDSVIKIRDYAISKKVHIFLIAHIKKIGRDVLVPDLYDVKGTSSLVNISKNVLIHMRTDILDRSHKQFPQLERTLEKNGYPDIDSLGGFIFVPKTKGRESYSYIGLKYDKDTCTYTEVRAREKKVQTKQIGVNDIKDEDLPF